MDEYVTEFNWDSVDVEGSPEYITRERIVRCRDCSMRGPDGFCDLIERRVMSDGFCAWGERRK